MFAMCSGFTLQHSFLCCQDFPSMGTMLCVCVTRSCCASAFALAWAWEVSRIHPIMREPVSGSWSTTSGTF